VGIPLTVGFRLSRSLWLSESPFTNSSFFTMEFRLSRILSQIFFSHGGISAILKPFHKFLFGTMEFRLSRSLFTNFSFTRWNLGYHEAFSRIFPFHMVESWLSQSLFTNFSFTRWNLCYHEAFSQIFPFHTVESLLS
jgi:hypothetical protein